MQKIIYLLAALLTPALFTGCTGPEQKLGRGLSNCCEFLRGGEMNRSLEQSAVFPRPGDGFYGVIHGFDRSVQRTGLGIVEVATFPIPFARQNGTFYGPILTSTYSADPPYPECNKPGRLSDSLFDTVTYSGFPDGDIAPFVSGSRFSVFGN